MVKREEEIEILPCCKRQGERVVDWLLFDCRGQEEYKAHLP